MTIAFIFDATRSVVDSTSGADHTTVQCERKDFAYHTGSVPPSPRLRRDKLVPAAPLVCEEVDVIASSTEKFAKNINNIGFIYKSINEEGDVLYG